MKFVGFGCSFTYGSELHDPEVESEFHWANTRYRERHCWLGQLAARAGGTWDNWGQPSGSNYSTQFEFARWFERSYSPDEPVVVAVAWTAPYRMSWWDDARDRYVHDGFLRNHGVADFGNVTPEDAPFVPAFKTWLTNSSGNSDRITSAAKLFVNSVCTARNLSLIHI